MARPKRGTFWSRHFKKKPFPTLPGKAPFRLNLGGEDDQPLNADARVQNCDGVLVPGQEPLVQPGMEDSTIAVQMTFGCLLSSFDASYVEGYLSLPPTEFHSAVAEFNRVLRRPPVWSILFAPCCCVPCCWRDSRLQRKAGELNRRFAAKGVRWTITTRLYQGRQAENEQNFKLAYFLVVEQQPPQATIDAAAASEADAALGRA